MKVPRTALTISPQEGSQFELLQHEEGHKDKRTRWRMVANSGGVIENHSHWGNFAIDLEGLNIGRQRKPALRDHDPQKIVGHTQSIQVTDEGLVAEGTFSDTDDGREVQAMLADGFPWQASVYVPPKAIQKLEEGESADVNGITIEGPGHVFRSSSLREVTFTSLGADENTGAAALSEVQITAVIQTAQPEEVFMDQENVVSETTESCQAEPQAADQASEMFQSGIELERQRMSVFLEVSLPDQLGLVRELISEGVSQEEGVKRLAKDIKDNMEAKLQHKLASTPEPVGPESDDQPADPREVFMADAELVAEFGNFEVYQAYTKALESGQIAQGDK